MPQLGHSDEQTTWSSRVMLTIVHSFSYGSARTSQFSSRQWRSVLRAVPPGSVPRVIQLGLKTVGTPAAICSGASGVPGALLDPPFVRGLVCMIGLPSLFVL